MRWISAVLLVVAACSAPPPVPPAPAVPPPWPAEIDVERLHTIGDLPPAASTVVVAIARDGALSVDGAATPVERIKETMKARAWPAAVKHGPSDLSATNVLIAADRDAPWSSPSKVLEGAAAAGEPRIFFAVRPTDGDDPGAVAVFLRADHGSQGIPVGVEIPFEVRVRFHAERGVTNPAQLLTGFREVLARRARPGPAFVIDAGASTSVGTVLRTCDVFWLAGAQRVEFAFSSDEPEPPGAPRAELLSADGVKPTDVPADLPKVARVRGAFAGSADIRASAGAEEAPVLPK